MAFWDRRHGIAVSDAVKGDEADMASDIRRGFHHDLDLVRQTTYRTIEMREGAVVFGGDGEETGGDDGRPTTARTPASTPAKTVPASVVSSADADSSTARCAKEAGTSRLSPGDTPDQP